MANAETLRRNPTQPDPRAKIAEIDQQLERNEANENTIERFFRHSELLELRDEIQAEIDTSIPPPDRS
jgi:hypothetical protein